MSLMVKICGITRAEDARAAVDAGADALGFMFYEPSKRFVTPEAAAEIIAQVPKSVDRVGVFVNADAATIHEVVHATGINVVQLHGEESPEFCDSLRPLTVWKAIRVEDEQSLDLVQQYNQSDAVLLDSFVPGVHGGTGHAFDWDLALKAKEAGCRIIIAGGLTPSNVAAAVESVRPFGVDVSSGVESAPGLKDAASVRSFVESARRAAG